MSEELEPKHPIMGYVMELETRLRNSLEENDLLKEKLEEIIKGEKTPIYYKYGVSWVYWVGVVSGIIGMVVYEIIAKMVGS